MDSLHWILVSTTVAALILYLVKLYDFNYLYTCYMGNLKSYNRAVTDYIKISKELRKEKENNLINTAMWSGDEGKANLAMVQLIKEFDPTYFFCNDCDGLATTKANCCLNRKIENIDKEL